MALFTRGKIRVREHFTTGYALVRLPPAQDHVPDVAWEPLAPGIKARTDGTVYAQHRRQRSSHYLGCNVSDRTMNYVRYGTHISAPSTLVTGQDTRTVMVNLRSQYRALERSAD